MTLTLTRDEADRLTADGRVVLFRPGVSYIHNRIGPDFGQWKHNPPAEFVEAAKPCETCEGRGIRYVDRSGQVYGNWLADELSLTLTIPCPDCLGGNRECPCLDGLVTVATVVVEWGPLEVVETIIEGEPCLVVVDGGYDWKGKKPPVLYRYRPGTGLPMEQLTLPPDIDPATLVGQYAIGVEVV